MLEKSWQSKSPEYMAFRDAKSRCTNKNKSNYHRYGGRGIEFKIKDFNEFFTCVGPRPDGMSLDRIDNNGNYEIGNIRWATTDEQNANKRKKSKHVWREAVEKAKSFTIIFPNGEKREVFNMAKFCREHGLNKSNLHSTIKNSWNHLGYKAIKNEGVNHA